MELKRRRKEEEKTSTENKIEEVKVSLRPFVFRTFLTIFLVRNQYRMPSDPRPGRNTCRKLFCHFVLDW